MRQILRSTAHRYLVVRHDETVPANRSDEDRIPGESITLFSFTIRDEQTRMQIITLLVESLMWRVIPEMTVFDAGSKTADVALRTLRRSDCFDFKSLKTSIGASRLQPAQFC